MREPSAVRSTVSNGPSVRDGDDKSAGDSANGERNRDSSQPLSRQGTDLPVPSTLLLAKGSGILLSRSLANRSGMGLSVGRACWEVLKVNQNLRILRSHSLCNGVFAETGQKLTLAGIMRASQRKRLRVRRTTRNRSLNVSPLREMRRR